MSADSTPQRYQEYMLPNQARRISFSRDSETPCRLPIYPHTEIRKDYEEMDDCDPNCLSYTRRPEDPIKFVLPPLPLSRTPESTSMFQWNFLSNSPQQKWCAGPQESLVYVNPFHSVITEDGITTVPSSRETESSGPLSYSPYYDENTRPPNSIEVESPVPHQSVKADDVFTPSVLTPRDIDLIPSEAMPSGVVGLPPYAQQTMFTPQPSRLAQELRASLDLELDKINNMYQREAPPPVTTIVDGFIYVGGFPSEETLEELCNLHITFVINCCPHYRKCPEASKRFRVEFIDALDEGHYYLLDYHYSHFCDLIRQVRNENGRVFVHCSGGINRSIALVSAYLMEYEGKSPLQIVHDIRQAGRKRILENSYFRVQLIDHYISLKPAELHN